MSDEDGDVNYNLEIPFTCVVSAGGPYDDEAFVRGFQLGMAYEILSTHHKTWVKDIMIVPEELMAQFDLIAMRYLLVTEILHVEDGFAHVLVKKQSKEIDI